VNKDFQRCIYKRSLCSSAMDGCMSVRQWNPPTTTQHSVWQQICEHCHLA